MLHPATARILFLCWGFGAAYFRATVKSHSPTIYQITVEGSDGRKLAKRQLEERHAAANRLLHSRSKAERTGEAARGSKARRDLDQHRIETGDDG